MKRTAALVAEAARLRRQGLSWQVIGGNLGLTADTVHGWLDPDFARRCLEKHYARSSTRASSGPRMKHVPERGRVADADAAARMAEIPFDDRPLDARLTGLPLKGRSALDMKVRHEN